MTGFFQFWDVRTSAIVWISSMSEVFKLYSAYFMVEEGASPQKLVLDPRGVLVEESPCSPLYSK